MNKQLSFTEALYFSNPRRKRSKTHQKLQQLNNLIDWKSIEQLFSKIDKTRQGKGGRPPIALSIKIKMLFLQHIYNMSDEVLEDNLQDNLAYQEFLGLSLSEDVPDFTTHWRFKERVIQKGLYDKLFQQINTQLDQQNLKVEKGHISIIDATIIASSNKPLDDNKRKDLEGNPQRDRDARNTFKHGRHYFGYKGHINMDSNTKLIQKQSFTSANVHDITQFEPLLTGKEKEVYADKAYRSRDLERKARLVKVKYGVMRKATRYRTLCIEEQQYNRQISKLRSRVEHVFGAMKKNYRYHQCRAKTKARNELTWTMNCIIYNMCRMNFLLKQSIRIG